LGILFAQKEAERQDFSPQMQNFLLLLAGAVKPTGLLWPILWLPNPA
jgi:hypothetical protein